MITGDAIDTLNAGVAAFAAGCRDQLLGFFLAPGSTFSLAALAASFAVLLLAAVPWRRGRPVRARVLLRAMFPRRLWRSASGRADIVFFTGGLLFAGIAIGWAIFSAEQVRVLAATLLGDPPARWLPGWAGAGIATVTLFVAYEFAYWLDHRLMHSVPAFWEFHKVHHQAESLSLLTNARVHPVETIGFYNLIAVMLGITQALLDRAFGAGIAPFGWGGTNALILLSAVAITHLQHSHLWIGFGPRWGRWLLGPAHHQIHHSADPAHFDRNLGSSLAVFDRLFGTFAMPAAARPALRFGVDDGAVRPHGFYAALAAPVVALVKRAMVLKPVAALSLVLLLGACGGGRSDRAPGPPPPSTREFAKCAADLNAAGVRFRALPDREFGGGCSAIGSVQLLDIGLPVANLGAMRCGLAERFTRWVRADAAPAAAEILGGELVKVETFGTYACRNTVGTTGPVRLSGHAIANAVDVSAFVLRDGRRISVLDGWRSNDVATRDFLQAVRRAACRRFGTVLSPDYNAAHANHLHLEDDGESFCR